MVGAGELGTDSRTLETQLSRILDIAHVWGAVLLLDEADVFLERRSVHDLQRNALVSIFLRLLEYFQGILFLTTNRVETFDEAFQSRIHIALRYNDLDKKARRVIWKTFLGMVAKEESGPDRALRDVVNDKELEGLARRELNGRQIKNAVRTAQALALSKNEGLSMEHLKLVLAVTEGFEHDLKGTGKLDNMMSYA
jgi:SpoVK/Ycf46/Vps4 family AAA+-type ATPase